MRPLSTIQRKALVRRLSRDIVYWGVEQWKRDNAVSMAEHLVDGLAWTGVHGASEKRAVELIVAKIEEETG